MIFKVKYTLGFFINEHDFIKEQKKCLTQGETFSEAIKTIENMEKDELMSVEEITPIAPDNVIFIEDEKLWKTVTKDIENNAMW